jgi:hypothetical protein
MVAVSNSAIKVCASLARKFKKDFALGAKELIVPLLLRFKEKKTSIIEDTHAALEAFIDCTNIEALKEELIDTGLKDASPSVRKELSAEDLYRCSTESFRRFLGSADENVG